MEKQPFLRKVMTKMSEFNELIYWMILFFYLETIVRVVNHSHLFTIGIVFSMIFDVFIAVLFSLLITSIKSGKGRRYIRISMTLLIVLLFLTQMIYFQIMKTYYTAYSAENTGKVLEFANIAFSTMLSKWYLVVLILLPLPTLFAIHKKHMDMPSSQALNAYPLTIKKMLFLVTFAILCQTIGIGLLHVTSREENSAYNVYYNIHFPEYAVDNLGLITYMRIDIQRRLFGWEPQLTAELDDAIAEVPTISAEVENTEGLTSTEETKESVTEIVETIEEIQIEYNVLNLDFDALIADASNASTIEMHQYFKSRIPSQKNEMTGKYKGYNLILLTAEGFSHLAVSESLTPTLYKMMHEGIYFENFYTPIWGVSTSDGEYVATTGLIPESGVWSYKKSSSNAMPFALGNQLRLEGYATNAYHDHTYTYYDRHLSHPNMGYDYKGVGNGLDITKSWPESDLEMMEVTIPEFVNTVPFHTYYMTVSGHMFYDFNGNAMSSKNHALVKDLPYSEHVKAYIACQIELENAMTYLLEQLEINGQLDHTLIALSADHYPYGLTKDEMEELAGHDIDDNFELYKNAFILYNNQMTPEVYTAPASSLDILPTLSNLMGLPFDSRLLMGRDLFSEAAPLVIFSNRSFITNEGRYNAKTGKFIQNEEQPIFDEATISTYRKQISSIIKAKFYYSAKVLEDDYYKLLMMNISE